MGCALGGLAGCTDRVPTSEISAGVTITVHGTLLELAVSLAVFTIFIIVLAGVEREMIRYDRATGTTFLEHPLPAAVTARVRRDVGAFLTGPSVAVAYKEIPGGPDEPVYAIKDECDLILIGFLAFLVAIGHTAKETDQSGAFPNGMAEDSRSGWEGAIWKGES